jgi:ubiquinone/menaquinone biosynthesis C-methylase UbiE
MNSSALSAIPSAPAPAAIGSRFPIEAVAANHFALVARNAANLRFGYDAEASVRFVVTHALPLWGRVLDLGTGKGRFMVALAPHVTQLTTVDISAEQQNCAKLEATYAGVAERIEFVLGDARQLPWPRAAFDAVVSMNAFHHLDDPEGVFNETLRVLKPAGKLVLADFSPDGFEIMAAIHRAEGQSHPYPPSQFARWEARLREPGFLVRRFRGHHQEVLVATHFALLPDSIFKTNPV